MVFGLKKKPLKGKSKVLSRAFQIMGEVLALQNIRNISMNNIGGNLEYG